MNQFDNLDEYRNPLMYDQENESFQLDIPFYEELSRDTGGQVLELACGTGRVTIPLAQLGFQVTGVDIAPEMLNHAKEKAVHADVSIRFLLGDCRQIQLQQQYGLIFMAGNAFQAFLDRQAQEEMLMRVREHLQQKGKFAFDTRNPNLLSLANGHGKLEELETTMDAFGNLVYVSERHWYDPISQIDRYVTYRSIRDASGKTIHTNESRIDLRYTFPQELESLLHYNGFILEHIYGDYRKSPLTATSSSMVCVCEKR